MLVLKHLCYDISDDKVRTKLADSLLAIGFTRIQESVYIGKIKPARLIRLIQRFQPRFGTQDKVFILDLTALQLQQMLQYGICFEVKHILETEETFIF